MSMRGVMAAIVTPRCAATRDVGDPSHPERRVTLPRPALSVVVSSTAVLRELALLGCQQPGHLVTAAVVLPQVVSSTISIGG